MPSGVSRFLGSLVFFLKKKQSFVRQMNYVGYFLMDYNASFKDVSLEMRHNVLDFEIVRPSCSGPL